MQPSFDLPPSAPDPHSAATPTDKATVANAMALHLDWSAYDSYGMGDAYAKVPAQGGGWGKAAAACIGNRSCQHLGKGVMCPSFRVTEQTEHSTGHRAATLRAALDGDFGDQPEDSAEVEAAMDLCIGCKGCKRECPNGVDMAALKVEYLAQRRSDRPWPRRERLMADWPAWAAALYPARMLLQWRRPGSVLAKLGERWLGIAARRSLPAWSTRHALTQLRELPTHEASRGDMASTQAVDPSAGPRVVLWVDTFTRWHEASHALAAHEFLTAIGCQVTVAGPPAGDDPGPLCCGRTAFSQGDVEQARRHALRTLDALTPALEAGAAIVGLEPSCLLMFRDEYLTLKLGPRAQTLARQSWLLEEYLVRAVDSQQLRRPNLQLAGTVHVHGHCHAKAFGGMKPLRKVLSWVEGLSIHPIDASCCGMAGAFGYEAEHYDVSMAMAELQLLPTIRRAAPDDWVLANGTSCRHQILDGTQRSASHLAQLLRAALPSPAAALRSGTSD